MSFAAAGIKEVFLAPGNVAFPVALASCYGLGVRPAGNFVISHKDPLVDFRGRTFTNMMNFRAEFGTLQFVDMDFLKFLVTAAKAGSISAAILTAGMTKGGTSPFYVDAQLGGLYKFDGSDFSTGIEFEMNMGMKERSIKIILEHAFTYADGLTLITEAATNQIPYAANKIPAIDETKVLNGMISLPFLSALSAGLQAAYANVYLDDFNVKLSTKGTKNGFNALVLSDFAVEMTATCSGPDAAVILAGLTHDAPAGDITVYLNPPTNTKSLIFKGHGLTRLGEVELGDEKRSLKITYAGAYDADLVAQNANDITFATFL